MNDIFPDRSGIDVGRLAGLFRDATQSYKFLFFRAILSCLAKGGGPELGYEAIAAEMVEAAWWPARRYRLSIGNAAGNDRFTKLLDEIGDDVDESLTSHRVAAIVSAKVGREVAQGILRYVPQRLLSPWIADVQKAAGGDFDRFVLKESLELRDALGMPYGVLPGRRGISMAPGWMTYIQDNFAIVSGWADMQWLAWVQARNPNVPVGMPKLGPPGDRISLARQQEFIYAAFTDAPPTCLYTGVEVARKSGSLDHFLPRSFVGHDRIWNLVPMTKAGNSSKGARLPRPELVDRLGEMHHRIIVAAKTLEARSSRHFIEQYASDLRLEPEALTDREQLVSAYRGMVSPMLSIAARMGFPQGWPGTP